MTIRATAEDHEIEQVRQMLLDDLRRTLDDNVVGSYTTAPEARLDGVLAFYGGWLYKMASELGYDQEVCAEIRDSVHAVEQPEEDNDWSFVLDFHGGPPSFRHYVAYVNERTREDVIDGTCCVPDEPGGVP